MVTFNEGNNRGPQDFVRQLGRIRGIVNERVSMMTDNGASIDFRMGFPSNPLVLHTNRDGGIGNSSVSLTSNNKVNTFALRYPPLPADIWQPADARELMGGMIAGTKYEGDVEIQINVGTASGEPEEWWPHILRLSFDTVSTEYVLELLRMTLPVYLEKTKEQTAELRDQSNG